MTPSLEKLRAELQAELKAKPRATPWWVGAVLLVSVNLVFCGATAMAFSPMVALRPLQWLTASVLVALLIAGAVTGIRPASRSGRLAVLVLSAVSLGLVLWSSPAFLPDVPFAAGTGCMAVECLVSLVPLVTSLVVLSRFAFDPLRAAAVGVAGGAGGLFALHLHCPNGDWAHLAAFHLLPWVSMTVLIVVVRRMLPTTVHAP